MRLVDIPFLANLVVISLLVPVSLTEAQPLTAAEVPPILATPADDVFRLVKDRILKSADKRDASIIRSVKIVVDVNDDDFYHVSAVNSSKTGRQIKISEGFLEALSLVNIAAADFFLHDHYSPNQFTDYLEYYSRGLLGSSDKITSKKFQSMMAQCAFLSQTMSECQARYRDPKFLGVLSGVVYSSYSFILAHELSHHLLHHLDNTATSRSQLNELGDHLNSNEEAAADEYGTKLLVRAGSIVDGALGTLGLLAYVQGPNGLGTIQNGYPHPLCRWIDVVSTEIAILKSESSIANHLTKLTPDGKDFEPGEEQMLERIKADVKECSAQLDKQNDLTK